MFHYRYCNIIIIYATRLAIDMCANTFDVDVQVGGSLDNASVATYCFQNVKKMHVIFYVNYIWLCHEKNGSDSDNKIRVFQTAYRWFCLTLYLTM